VRRGADKAGERGAVTVCRLALHGRGGVTARWTFPTLLKGTGYVFADLMEKKHLIVWALLAGALWAVANTLTVFAIRDVGLAVAFPRRCGMLIR